GQIRELDPGGFGLGLDALAVLRDAGEIAFADERELSGGRERLAHVLRDLATQATQRYALLRLVRRRRVPGRRGARRGRSMRRTHRWAGRGAAHVVGRDRTGRSRARHGLQRHAELLRELPYRGRGLRTRRGGRGRARGGG